MFKLSCCTTVDMDLNFFKERDINYLMLKYLLDDEIHNDDCGQTIDYSTFYSLIRSGKMPTTSQLNPIDYEESFEHLLSKGYDILHITLSSGISGTYFSALQAKENLEKKFPNHKIYIVDSLSASSGSGLLVSMASDMQREGKSIDEIYTWLENNKQNINHFFFTTDLSHLKRGGRISPAAFAFANMLNICPVLTVSKEGKLVPFEKVRGVKKCLKVCLDKMLSLAEHNENYDGYCLISHSDSLGYAEELKKQISEKFPNLPSIKINNIGMVIGSHTGPGTVALYFYGKKREI